MSDTDSNHSEPDLLASKEERLENLQEQDEFDYEVTYKDGRIDDLECWSNEHEDEELPPVSDFSDSD